MKGLKEPRVGRNLEGARAVVALMHHIRNLEAKVLGVARRGESWRILASLRSSSSYKP